MILVTGASGANGLELVQELGRRGVPFRAMVRSLDKSRRMAALKDVEILAGDFDDLQSIEQALAGVERAFLLTPSSEKAQAQQIAFVEVAARAGVRHLVLLSQFASASDSPVRFLRYHAAVEDAIRASGLDWTFLRPNLFMQGLLQFKDMIATRGYFAAAIGEARVSVVDVRDNAAAAAAALLEDGHAGKTYDLTGPEALTHAEMAEKLSKALGRPVAFHDVPESTMADGLRAAHMPDWQIDGLLEDYAHYRRGEAAVIATGVLQATGRPPRSFDDFARERATSFGAG